MSDMWKKGRSDSKLTDDDVLEIRRLYRDTKLTQEQIGLKFGVVQSRIGDIVRYNTWRHVS
jgi:predicted XRE-type DNA-binding protein